MAVKLVIGRRLSLSSLFGRGWYPSVTGFVFSSGTWTWRVSLGSQKMNSAYPMGNLAILGDCNEDCIAKADGCYSRLDAFDCPNSPFGGSREGGFGLLDGIGGRVIDCGHFTDSRSMRWKLLLMFSFCQSGPASPGGETIPTVLPTESRRLCTFRFFSSTAAIPSRQHS